jgi:hypothetical protein
VTAKRGDSGDEVSDLNLHIFTTETIHYLYALNVASETSTQTLLFIEIKSTHMCPFPIPLSSEIRSQYELDAAR